jgi:voltage-gated potassium channel
VDSFNVITSVLYEKKNQIASSMFIIAVLMLASSICMYSAENPAQPENFSNAFDGIWWSVSTLLTIGYGDVYPVTLVGKIMAICIAFLGVGVVAIPTGIISAGFVEQYHKAQASADALNINLQTVIVDIDSRWIGLSVDEVLDRFGIHIVLVQRGDVLIQPNDKYIVEMHDALAVWEGKVRGRN